jgi:hypothetical protein
MALYVSMETVQRLVMADQRSNAYIAHMIHMLEEWMILPDLLARDGCASFRAECYQ